uniref:Uncharacterized protein n=1 Tax=Ditylenchus dipsaci TaxID=166011 RepID=A0A915DTA8_9BILA
MESDSDSDVNVFGDSSEEEVSATIRASSERIPTKVVNDAVVRFVCGKRKSQYSLIYEGSFWVSLSVVNLLTFKAINFIIGLTPLKQNLFPRGSFAPADLIIPEGWSVHTDGSQIHLL